MSDVREIKVQESREGGRKAEGCEDGGVGTGEKKCDEKMLGGGRLMAGGK